MEENEFIELIKTKRNNMALINGELKNLPK